jgi:hypothetical protein
MKNIFLSASIPLPDCNPKYYETADIIAIRDAVIALASITLTNYRIIWGGHPSITPLIYYVIEKKLVNNLQRDNWDTPLNDEEKEALNADLKGAIQQHVLLYQSRYFEGQFPPENAMFENVVYTPNFGDIPSSIQVMREKMLNDNDFSAAVFIGGMEGVEDEFKLFREFHSNVILLPIASTGAAAKIIYDELLPQHMKNERLEKDYGYMSLFQKLLIDKI